MVFISFVITRIFELSYVIDNGSWSLSVEASMIQIVHRHHQTVDQPMDDFFGGNLICWESKKQTVVLFKKKRKKKKKQTVVTRLV